MPCPTFMALESDLNEVKKEWGKDRHTDTHTENLELGLPCALTLAYHQQAGNSMCLFYTSEFKEVIVFVLFWFGFCFVLFSNIDDGGGRFDEWQ